MARRKNRHRRVIIATEPAQTATLLGLDDHRFSDLYHRLLTASWPALLMTIAAVFAAVNAIFAVIYMLDRGIENARPGSFADAFFFSVQTMATIGYGKLAPDTVLANIMMSVEALTGLLGLAMVTGLVFAKFSRPTARVRFSSVAVISKRDGVQSLMFRMANVRGNRIVDATVHVVLARQERTLEGEDVRRFYDLALQRYRNSIFSYSWTAIHPISESSPLHGQTPQSLERRAVEIIVSMMGLDESFGQTVHARHSYRPPDIKWGVRLADILERTPQGLVIDYSRFDEVVPAA